MLTAVSINEKTFMKYLRSEFFLTVVWILQAEFYLRSRGCSSFMPKIMKNLQNVSLCLIWSKKNKISNLQGQSQSKVLHLDWQYKVPRFHNSLIYYTIHEKIVKFFMCKMLNIYDKIPMSVFTSLKLKIK